MRGLSEQIGGVVAFLRCDALVLEALQGRSCCGRSLRLPDDYFVAISWRAMLPGLGFVVLVATYLHFSHQQGVARDSNCHKISNITQRTLYPRWLTRPEPNSSISEGSNILAAGTVES